MCTDDQHQQKMALLRDINKQLARLDYYPPIDCTAMISTNQPLILDYKGRKHLFLWSANDLTCTVEDIGQLTIAKNTWVNIGYQEGMRLIPTAQSTTVPVFVRATDETIP